MFSKHKLHATLGGDWLYFSHVKNAMRKADWTYHFFTCENIAHIEFYLQELLPKILAIYTLKIIIAQSTNHNLLSHLFCSMHLQFLCLYKFYNYCKHGI